jgi:hypothetical protein
MIVVIVRAKKKAPFRGLGGQALALPFITLPVVAFVTT